MAEPPRGPAYDASARLVLDHFGLDALEVRFLGHNSGVAYRVRTAAQDYVLKIHIPHGSSEVLDPAGVEAGLEWLAALAALEPGFPVQSPVRDSAGRVLPRISLDWFSSASPCSVQQWVEGDAREGDLTEEQGAAMGEMTARLHDCASSWAPPDGLAATVVDAAWFASRLQALLGRLDHEMVGDEDRAAIEVAGSVVDQALAQVPSDRRVFGPVHGDLHPENIVWVGLAPRPIDFARLLLAPYAWDLGVLCYHTMYLPPAFRRSLVAAYVETRTDAGPPPPLEAFVVAAAVDNLAFQLSIPGQRGSALLKRNLAEFARRYCRSVAEGRDFVLS